MKLTTIALVFGTSLMHAVDRETYCNYAAMHIGEKQVIHNSNALDMEIQKTREKLEILEAIKNTPLIAPLSQEEIEEFTQNSPCELQR